ncbi:MAG: FecR domain-containing protein [Planctomycetota bacterium]
MDDSRDIIERYLAGELKDAEQAKLTRWLEADEANRQAFLAEVDFYRTVRGVLIQEQQELAKQAEASGSDQLPAVEMPSDTLTTQKYLSALSYVLRHTFTPKRLITGGLAAAVLLGAVLAIVLLTGGPEETESIAAELDDTSDPVRIARENPVVATLTATQNAEWAEGALAPASDLKAGQTLTLTAGYAKLTTRRGAVALLEAPCTIELIDSPNAIRLHAGKLVGICETDRSKGFLVRTPHLDVTDIGTRFGVATGDTTSVSVIEGEVELSTEQSSAPVALTTGQTSALDLQAQAIVTVSNSADRFITNWNAVANPPQLTGDIRYEPAMPQDLQEGAYESDQLVVFYEQSVEQLDAPLAVTITESDTFDDFGSQQAILPTHTSFDSYFVHLDPPVQIATAEESKRYTATILFDRPILAVIASSQHLKESHAVLGQPNTAYSELETSGIERSQVSEQTTDRITLSKDRKTLDVELYTGLAIDQLRILVQIEKESN